MAKRTVLQDFSIRLIQGNALLANHEASRSFEIASEIWSEIFKDVRIDTPINVNVDLASLRLGVLGSTHTIDLVGPYCGPDGILPEPLRSHVGSNFPVCSNITYNIPSRTVYRGNMLYCKPNLKALGFISLDSMFGPSDGSITFSNRFSFDYDLSDGLDPHKTDFLSVVLHEMGHLFGFVSGVDDVDAGSPEFTPSILDLYRFEMNLREIDFLADERIGNPRVSNQAFWGTFVGRLYRFSTGTRVGDGNQASHWGADELYGNYVGLMDPSLAAGKSLSITTADILAFKALGYNINPEMKPFVIHHEIEQNSQSATFTIFAQLMIGDEVSCRFKTRQNQTIETSGYKGTGKDVVYCMVEDLQSVASFSIAGELGNYSDEIEI